MVNSSKSSNFQTPKGSSFFRVQVRSNWLQAGDDPDALQRRVGGAPSAPQPVFIAGPGLVAASVNEKRVRGRLVVPPHAGLGEGGGALGAGEKGREPRDASGTTRRSPASKQKENTRTRISEDPRGRKLRTIIEKSYKSKEKIVVNF